MGRTVSEYGQSFLGLDLDRTDDGIFFQGGAQVNNNTVYTGGDGPFLLFVGLESGQRLSHRRGGGDLDGFSFLQCYREIGHCEIIYIKTKAKERTPVREVSFL